MGSGNDAMPMLICIETEVKRNRNHGNVDLSGKSTFIIVRPESEITPACSSLQKIKPALSMNADH